MTFQLLNQTQTSLLNSEPYQSTGTDQAEYEKWMKAIHGDINVESELEQDLQDMGL